MLTPTLLAQIMQCPLQRAQRWAEPLNAAMKRFGINTPVRAAYFLAQLGHESLSLSRVEESLSYSRERLLEVFGSYITPVRQPGSFISRQSSATVSTPTATATVARPAATAICSR